MLKNEIFRPWGLLPWVSSKISTADWEVLGCLSSEERSIGIAQSCEESKLTPKYKFIEITNPASNHEVKAQLKRNDYRSRLINNFSVSSGDFVSMELMESSQDLGPWIDDFIQNSSKNIILDISTFPKRFFFQIIKKLVNSTKIKNLQVTYTVPQEYEKQISFDPKIKNYLPTFQNKSHKNKELIGILGVGFLSFDLPDLLKSHFSDIEQEQIHLLFPFPPGPPNFQKNWEFVREIEKSGKVKHDKQIIRTSTLDVSACFEHICSIARDKEESTVCFPFGPKPHALAMCLFALNHGNGVFYIQPESYHPDYSKGINTKDDLTETYSYFIKMNGNNLYKN